MLGTKSRTLDCPVLVSLDALVPKDNLYRRLDNRLDLSFVRDWMKDCYAERGRPSVDPIVFFKPLTRRAGWSVATYHLHAHNRAACSSLAGTYAGGHFTRSGLSG